MNLRYIHYKSKMQVYRNLYIWLSNVKEQDNLRLGIIFKPIEKKRLVIENIPEESSYIKV